MHLLLDDINVETPEDQVPTFNDPAADADETQQAPRGLANPTRPIGRAHEIEATPDLGLSL